MTPAECLMNCAHADACLAVLSRTQRVWETDCYTADTAEALGCGECQAFEEVATRARDAEPVEVFSGILRHAAIEHETTDDYAASSEGHPIWSAASYGSGVSLTLMTDVTPEVAAAIVAMAEGCPR